MSESETVPRRPMWRRLLSDSDEVEREVQRRVISAAELWPTLEQAVGCLGCRRIFRHLEAKSQLCPHCRSAATFDITPLLQRQSSMDALAAMVERLDTVLFGAGVGAGSGK